MSEPLLDNTPKQRLKEENMILAMAIMSIFFFTIIGVLLAIATLIKTNSTLSEYDAHPTLYRERSYKKVKAAKILAISGFGIKIILVLLISAFA